MVYKNKKEYDQAVIQFVGDCVMSGMSKHEAVAAAQEKFTIGSPATVYCIVRRVIGRRRFEEERRKEANNG